MGGAHNRLQRVKEAACGNQIHHGIDGVEEQSKEARWWLEWNLKLPPILVHRFPENNHQHNFIIHVEDQPLGHESQFAGEDKVV